MDSAFVDNYRFLARYNRWFNRRLYDACERIPDAERRDRGAFFGSIHNTLNHLVWGDQLWLARFAVQEGVNFASREGCSIFRRAPCMSGALRRWDALRMQREKPRGDRGWVAEMPGTSAADHALQQHQGRAATASGLDGAHAFLQSPDAPPRAGHGC